MKVHVLPSGTHSTAMKRIARALTLCCPPDLGFSFVRNRDEADLHVYYPIGADAIDFCKKAVDSGKKYALVQCCLDTSGAGRDLWLETWQKSLAVWSYYDLSLMPGVNFYHAPLGIDPVFVDTNGGKRQRDRIVVTTGYVSGPGAEPIDEVWMAAREAGVESVHVGPGQVEGATTKPTYWCEQPTDQHLAEVYGSAAWVSAMRYVEGFEMPGIEGLACGCRPIAFDQVSQLLWYSGAEGRPPLAHILPELSGQELVGVLAQLFGMPLDKVSEDERLIATRRFGWDKLVEGFWRRVASQLTREPASSGVAS